MNRAWRWFLADIRGDHRKPSREGFASREDRVPTPVLALLIVLGSVAWFSDLFIHESSVTRALVGFLGLFAAFYALNLLVRRRGWWRRRRS